MLKQLVLLLVLFFPIAQVSGDDFMFHPNGFTHFTDINSDAFQSQEVENPEDGSGDSEVVSPPPVVEEVKPTPPPIVEKPKPKPTPPKPQPNPPKPEPAPQVGNVKIWDMSNCRYSRSGKSGCYGGLSFTEKTKRILEAAHYVNKLHKTKFDGRYMLCTGWRESTFNPGAVGADGERGMFQVMAATGKAALRYGVELPEFKRYDANTYMTKMANSTVAQVELSFLTLQMKLDEWASGKSRNDKERIMSIMRGTGTNDDYWQLARRYNGGGPKAYRYANAIKNCYVCLKEKISVNATQADSRIEPCLRRAKH